MKFFYTSLLLLIFSLHISYAQLDVTTGYTAMELAEMLSGGGVTIEDATLDCTSQAFGKFECIDCNLGIDSGFILTTGKAIYAEGPNNSGSTGFSNGTTGDSDLEALPGVGTTYDRCILEIDFIPSCDTVKFDYAFGSDEYNEFVGSINDVFALWISGPGIIGVVNIALIPGTTLPVTIDNVNLGSYATYYNNNPSAGVALTDPYYIEYDGFTDVFEAFSIVIPGETYHLKFAIADESDHVYDSGVFFKAGSLEAGISASFVLPGTGFGLASYCTSSSDPTPEMVPGAIIGEFTATPEGLVIDPSTGTIDISESIPGTYTITNTVIGLACGVLDTVTSSSDVLITELPIGIFSYPESPFCTDETDPSPTPGTDAQLGTFSATPAGLSIASATGIIDLSASTAGTYTVTNYINSADGCPSVTSTTSVTISPSYDLSQSYELCDGETHTLPDGTSVTTSGTYPVLLSTVAGCDSLITTNITVHPVYATSQSATICDGDPFYLPDGGAVLIAGTYVTTVATIHGCDSVVTTTLSVNPIPSTSVTAEICSGEFFTLPDGAVTSTAGTYTSVLTAYTDCDSLVYTTLTVHPIFTTPVSVNICPDDIYILPDGTSVSSPGTYTTTLNSIYGCDSVINTTLGNYPLYDIVFNPEMCDGGEYILPDGNIATVSDTYINNFLSINGCDSIITTNLTVHPNPEIDFPIDPIVCFEEGVIALTAIPTGGNYAGIAISGNQFNAQLAGVGGPYEITYSYMDMHGCVDTAIQFISVDQNFAEAYGDTSIIATNPIYIWGNSGGNYAWTPAYFITCASCESSTAYPTSSGYITLTSTNENGCVASDKIYVYVLPYPENNVFIPNAFTPNGDGVNDYLFAYSPILINIKSFDVYDRWGNIIYHRENLSPDAVTSGWDGTSNGKKLNPGVYPYIITVQYENGEIKQHAGNVTLLSN